MKREANSTRRAAASADVKKRTVCLFVQNPYILKAARRNSNKKTDAIFLTASATGFVIYSSFILHCFRKKVKRFPKLFRHRSCKFLLGRAAALEAVSGFAEKSGENLRSCSLFRQETARKFVQLVPFAGFFANGIDNLTGSVVK